MLQKKYILGMMLAAATLLLASCVEKADLGEFPTDFANPATKVVHQPVDIDNGSLLVLFKTAPDEAALQALYNKGAVSVERVFNSVPGKEELERQYRMDRWYLVKLPDNQTAESACPGYAEIPQLELVEYNILFRKTSDDITYPFDGDLTPATKADAVFNDPMLKDQWHYINRGNVNVCTTCYKGADVNVEPVWQQLTCGDNAIIVAVIDEAVKPTHPDLQGNIWYNEKERSGQPGVDDDGNGYIDDITGFNFVDMIPEFDYTTYGNSGHGTHCAGTIAAVNNNTQGVCGLAGGSGKGDGVRIMSCQIFTGDGEGHTRGATVQNTARAIKYAADNGAWLISCSYGYHAGAFTSDDGYMGTGGAEGDAIHYFEACKNGDVLDGNVAIFASGNDGKDFAGYPGALYDIISVSAFGPDYLPTYYTNYGPGCNITAPGGEAYLAPWNSYAALVLSTLPSEVNNGEHYGYMQGTSMACPHVTGVAALGLAYARKLGKHFTVAEFKNLLVTSARDFDTRLNGQKTYLGARSSQPLELYNYRKMMGSGAIDTWLLCMQIEGIPSITAKVGENQWLDISPYFGTASINLTYLGRVEGEGQNAKYYIDVDDNARNALGLAEDPYVQYGRLWIHPTKIGAAKITVKAVGGGTEIGGGKKIGGMPVEHQISIISRNIKSSNGGWL